jgi:hypothetical protein
MDVQSCSQALSPIARWLSLSKPAAEDDKEGFSGIFRLA